jgi:hypothetical protein
MEYRRFDEDVNYLQKDRHHQSSTSTHRHNIAIKVKSFIIIHFQRSSKGADNNNRQPEKSNTMARLSLLTALLRIVLFALAVSSSSAFAPNTASTISSHHHNHHVQHSPSFLMPQGSIITTGKSSTTTALSATTATATATVAIIQTALASSGVQKVLELGVLVAIGALLRDQLDANATTSLLLKALVPGVIVSSLSSLTLNADMGWVLLSGVALALIQLGAGELASRFVIPSNNKTARRTAALQLGTMAPALSVYSFTREFVGTSFAGLAALADIPTKIYGLILIPYYLIFRGEKTTSEIGTTVETSSTSSTTKPSFATRLSNIFSDPFNLSISAGLLLAALGRPVASLGFVGAAVTSLASAQISILFLLIGLKLKLKGDSLRLCLRLLLARHGFCSLAMSAVLATVMKKGFACSQQARLAAVLSSHAACSIIAFAQMTKVKKAGVQGYDTDLARS